LEILPVSAETFEPILAITESPANVPSAVPLKAWLLKTQQIYRLNYPPFPLVSESFALLIQDQKITVYR
jgi:hypothetical protein